MANYCSNCGNSVSSSDAFCPNCGASLSANANASASASTNNSTNSVLGTLVAVTLLGGITRNLYFYHGHYFLDPYCRRPFRGSIVGPHRMVHGGPMPRGGVGGPHGGPGGGFGGGPHGGGHR